MDIERIQQQLLRSQGKHAYTLRSITHPTLEQDPDWFAGFRTKHHPGELSHAIASRFHAG